MIQTENLWRVLLPTGEEGTCHVLGRITAPSEDAAKEKARILWPERADRLIVETVTIHLTTARQ